MASSHALPSSTSSIVQLTPDWTNTKPTAATPSEEIGIIAIRDPIPAKVAAHDFARFSLN